MLTQELKEQLLNLPVEDRVALASDLMRSVEGSEKFAPLDRISAYLRLRGLLKTEQPAPTDEEVAFMLEERRMEKYGL